jgi:hypothetical protein
MFIKKYNTNSYVFIDINKFAYKKNFYEEVIRIKFNKVFEYESPINKIESLMK